VDEHPVLLALVQACHVDAHDFVALSIHRSESIAELVVVPGVQVCERKKRPAARFCLTFSDTGTDNLPRQARDGHEREVGAQSKEGGEARRGEAAVCTVCQCGRNVPHAPRLR
jgi:hypothetical protein